MSKQNLCKGVISECRTKIYLIIIAFASTICFINSLNGEFVYDDSEAIVNNDDVKLVTPIWQLFHNDFWGTRLTRKESHKSYRPITVLTFRLNTLLSGGDLNPFGFHLVNFILHTAVSIISFFVFKTLTGEKYKTTSFVAAIMFTLHPIHTEAVAGIVGRADLLCTLFVFCGLLTYARGIQISHTIGKNIGYTFVTILFAAFAMFAKEQGITLIGICSAYDVLIVNKLHPMQIFKWRITKLINLPHNKTKINLRGMLIRNMVLCLGGVVLFLARWYIMGGNAPVFQKVDNPAAFIDDVFLRILNYNYIYSLNAWLLICPLWLCCDWSMGCIPILTSVEDIRLLSVVCFWVMLFLLLAVGLMSVEEGRLVLMCLAFIIISFLPASNIFFHVGFVVAERVLYLPSTGFCMLVALGFTRLCIASNYKVVLQGCLISLLLTFSARCIERNMDWRDERSLFLAAASVCPLNAKIHYNLGKTTLNLSLAAENYREAIRLNPEYDQAMNNLANILKDDQNYKEAEYLLKQAVKLRPDFAAAWMNLGIVLSHGNNFAEAEKCYVNAIKFRKHYPDCYYNLGNLYLGQKKYTEALQAWRTATSLQPKHKVAWNNIIIMLDSIGNFTSAIEVGEEALSILPTDPGIHFNIANTLGKLGRFEEAEQYFKKAIDFKSDYALYYVNLGVLYHRWKKLDLAKAMYRQALKVDPNIRSAKDNLALIQ